MEKASSDAVQQVCYKFRSRRNKLPRFFQQDSSTAAAAWQLPMYSNSFCPD